MAEEVQNSSGTNKMKQTRWGTGFSAPPDSYNSVLPLGAQEIAARFVNTAEAKRPRVDNNGVKVGAGVSIPMISTTLGMIIGKGGKTIRYLQLQSGAKIQVTWGLEWDPYSPTRPVELMGTSYQMAKAEQLIQDVLAEAESGGSVIVSRRVTLGQPGYDRFLMQIKIGPLIGKSGETIKSIQVRAGARIQLCLGSKFDVVVLWFLTAICEIQPDHSFALTIEGTSEQIETAKELVSEVCWIGPKGVGDGTTEWAIGSHASSVEPSHTREGTDVCCLLPLISEVREERKAILSNIFRLWPSNFLHLGGAISISRKLAFDSLVSFAEVVENVSLPGAPPEDFDSARNGFVRGWSRWLLKAVTDPGIQGTYYL
ncbi:hypothetical protein RHMOL_Rhmol01G0100400 [Rhododendron molle]|uniref:Uncharacterized protein n=1 Tax=Rhododendron molle TaxID=49168 RepID=A0ACC0Q1C7_RHOML|nr:hypothetical protein RHMOL_Rhmol01G0100400 [Rhododendron molle]